MSASRRMQEYDPGPRAAAEGDADWLPEYEDDDLLGEMTPSMHASGRQVGNLYAYQPEVRC